MRTNRLTYDRQVYSQLVAMMPNPDDFVQSEQFNFWDFDPVEFPKNGKPSLLQLDGEDLTYFILIRMCYALVREANQHIPCYFEGKMGIHCAKCKKEEFAPQIKQITDYGRMAHALKMQFWENIEGRLSISRRQLLVSEGFCIIMMSFVELRQLLTLDLCQAAVS